MTLPEGRQPITSEDMAKMHPSTWEAECKARRARVAKLEAALSVIADADPPNGWNARRVARAALQEGKQ
jgi:hypothetical protein